MSRRTIPAFALIFGAGIVFSPSVSSGQSTYDDFTVFHEEDLGPGEDLKTWIEQQIPAQPQGPIHLFISEGFHVVDNSGGPIVINYDGEVVIHGEGRVRTTISAQTNGPLFRIERAQRLSIATMKIRPNASGEDINFVAFDFSGAAATETVFEMVDVFMVAGSIEIHRPGQYFLQGNLLNARGQLAAGSEYVINVDHPGAELYVVGGKVNGGRSANIRQGAGHVEVYGTLLNNLGHADYADVVADVRLEAPSPRAAHFIAAVRSEGSKESPPVRYRLVFVPETSEAVDVVIKANQISSPQALAGPLVDYNGAGTVWILGNTLQNSANQFVEASQLTAPSQARFVVIGNTVRGDANLGARLDTWPPELIPVSVADESSQIFHVWTVFDTQRFCERSEAPNKPADCTERPLRRVLEPGVNFASFAPGSIPEPPQNTNPQNGNKGEVPILSLPVMNVPVGDVETLRARTPAEMTANDDGPRLQEALDRGDAMGVFIPEGVYTIHDPLVFHSVVPPSAKVRFGGRIFGAGSDKTTIQIDENEPVFTSTTGMHSVTIQGITFRAQPGSPVNFDLNDDHVSSQEPGQQPSTQSNSFDDVVFDGGQQGLGILLDASAQGDGTFCGHCTFKNAGIGLANGGANAVGNLVHHGLFENNDIDVGGGLNGFAAGSVRILSATSKNAGSVHVAAKGLNAALYINQFTVDPATGGADKFLERTCSTALQTVWIENSKLGNAVAPGSDYINYARSGVLNLHRTEVPDGRISGEFACGTSGETALLSLQSDLGGAVEFVDRTNANGPSYHDRLDAVSQTVSLASVPLDDGRVWEPSFFGGANGDDDDGSALRIGQLSVFGTPLAYRSVVSFDTSALPDQAEILSAALVLQRGGAAGSDPFQSHGRVLVDVVSGSFGGSPSLDSSDYDAPSTAPASAELIDDGTEASAQLDATGLAAIDLTGLTQLRIGFEMETVGSSTAYVGYHSGESEGLEPQLLVEYRE